MVLQVHDYNFQKVYTCLMLGTLQNANFRLSIKEMDAVGINVQEAFASRLQNVCRRAQ